MNNFFIFFINIKTKQIVAVYFENLYFVFFFNEIIRNNIFLKCIFFRCVFIVRSIICITCRQQGYYKNTYKIKQRYIFSATIQRTHPDFLQEGKPVLLLG